MPAPLVNFHSTGVFSSVVVTAGAQEPRPVAIITDDEEGSVDCDDTMADEELLCWPIGPANENCVYEELEAMIEDEEGAVSEETISSLEDKIIAEPCAFAISLSQTGSRAHLVLASLT